jgi:hypothetical protein
MKSHHPIRNVLQYDDHDHKHREVNTNSTLSYLTLEEKAKLYDMQSEAANQLSVRLLNTTSEDDEVNVLRESLDLSSHTSYNLLLQSKENNHHHPIEPNERSRLFNYGSYYYSTQEEKKVKEDLPPAQNVNINETSKPKFVMGLSFNLCPLLVLTLLFFTILGLLMYWGVKAVGPPNRPIGAYRLIERQVRPTTLTHTGMSQDFFLKKLM